MSPIEWLCMIFIFNYLENLGFKGIPSLHASAILLVGIWKDKAQLIPSRKGIKHRAYFFSKNRWKIRRLSCWLNWELSNCGSQFLEIIWRISQRGRLLQAFYIFITSNIMIIFYINAALDKCLFMNYGPLQEKKSWAMANVPSLPEKVEGH